MAESSSIMDGGDPRPYLVVQYVERYGAGVSGLLLVAFRLWGDAKGIHDGRTGRTSNADVG